MTYQATWESIDARPTPAWFDEAKFGIMIHWGLYSVPSWGPKGQYSEWYWFNMNHSENPTRAYHREKYGEKFGYQDFVSGFTADFYDPNAWAELFVKSGARYVVPTSKHHDGFCLWPSAQSWNWNSVDVGPHRDLLGDLATAVRAKNLKMGLYYSLYEWYRPLYLADPRRYAREHMIPQLKDLCERYQPSIIFTDGEWDHPSDVWSSCDFLAWLFNEAPNRHDVVVNDRWGKDTRSKHGGYYTTEYGEVGFGHTLSEGRKWEECRGVGKSFGFNRNEDLSDYLGSQELIHLLVDTVSKGGNLELNVGPTADGRIPVIMQERLTEIGEWMKINGEAIYGTRPWRVNAEGKTIRYTSKGDTVYAIATAWPGEELVLSSPCVRGQPVVSMLGYEGNLRTTTEQGALRIEVPIFGPDQLPCRHAWAFRLGNVA